MSTAAASADATGLDRLHDIVLPPASSLWPPAPGWLWLLGIAAVLLAWALLRALAHWQRNCYRREALAELARAEAMAGGDRDAALRAMSELLKRTALTAYPRVDVAAHTGPAWFAYLDEAAGTRFAQGLGAQLEQAVYHRAPATGAGDGRIDAREVAAEIRRWIRQHRARPVARDAETATS